MARATWSEQAAYLLAKGLKAQWLRHRTVSAEGQGHVKQLP